MTIPAAKQNTEKCVYCSTWGYLITWIVGCLRHSVLLSCWFAVVGIEEGKKYVEKIVLKYEEIMNSVDGLCRSLRELKEIKVCFFNWRMYCICIELSCLVSESVLLAEDHLV